MKTLNQIIKILTVIAIIVLLSMNGHQVLATNTYVTNENGSNPNIIKIADEDGEKNASGGNESVSDILNSGKEWLQHRK